MLSNVTLQSVQNSVKNFCSDLHSCFFEKNLDLFNARVFSLVTRAAFPLLAMSSAKNFFNQLTLKSATGGLLVSLISYDLAIVGKNLSNRIEFMTSFSPEPEIVEKDILHQIKELFKRIIQFLKGLFPFFSQEVVQALDGTPYQIQGTLFLERIFQWTSLTEVSLS